MNTILFLNKAPPYRSSGAEKVIWELGKHLAANDWDVNYLCPLNIDDTTPPNIENITFHNVATPGSYLAGRVAYFVVGIPECRRLVDDLEPDLIYDNASPLMFPYAQLAQPERTVTKVHGVNGREAFTNKPHLPTKIGTFLGDQLYRLKDGRRMLTVSQSTKDRLAGRVRTNPDEITVVQNGIEVSDLDYQFSPDGPILSLCMLTPRKDIATLLKAWKRLEQDGVDRELIIAGDGPSRDRLEGLAADLGVQQVTFKGYVPEAEKKRLLEEAYCYVLPTRLEGLGLSNLEAMASGCVVISTHTDGVWDYLEHDTNGLAVPPEAPDALAAAIKRTVADTSLGKRLARAGRKTVEQEFRIEEAVERERKVLAEFIDQGEKT